MKTKFFSFLLLFLPALLGAQRVNLVVKGMVADSSGTGLSGVSVVMLQQADSLLSGFGSTDEAGNFTLKRIKPGDYLLQISFVGFETHYQALTLSADRPDTDLGTLRLKPASLTLSGVDITAERAPLVLKRDTIEYNAAAFKVQPGSVVEDLLKKLPGVEVSKDGTIKAQGETVQNVLVEGKEFFGKDPKVATKNLPADAVDKVQLFDKKSDMAAFTGIDDGRDERTINLKLKDGKKHGYFGNISAGYGTEERYEGKFNVNRFGKNAQISAIGMANNNNQEGFSLDEYMNFMGGLSNFMSPSAGGGGRISIDLSNLNGMAGGGGNGLTDLAGGGLNLNWDLSKKTEINAHYFYNRVDNLLDQSTSRINLLDTGNFNSDEADMRNSLNNNHRVNLTLRHRPDSAQRLTLRSNFTFNDAFFENSALANTYGTDGGLENRGARDYFASGLNLRGNANLTWRLRLGKRGRNLAVSGNYESADDERNGDLRAQNEYFTPGREPDLINQRQAYTDKAENFGGSFAYTEPIGKKQFLQWQIGHRQYSNRSVKDFYDRYDVPTPGEIYNTNLSNRFRRGYRYESLTMNYTRNREKTNLTLGTALQQSVLEGELPGENLDPVRRTFTRMLPQAFFNYEIGRGKNVSLDYTTNLREPSLEQLSPILDNSNPLSGYLGNPDLQPAYEHNLNSHFLFFDQFTMTTLFANLRASYVRDNIVNASSIDSLFRTVLQPVNVAYDFSANGNLNFSTPLRFMKTNFRADLGTTLNRGLAVVNEEENKTRRWNHSLEFSLDNRKKDKFDLSVGYRLGLNGTRFEDETQFDQNYYSQSWFADLLLTPFKKWNFGTDIDYAVYSGESFGDRLVVPVWRAQITRYLLKNNKGQLRLTAFDLLDRNRGIQRSGNLNYIEERRIRNLGRYFMLTFAYSLAGFDQKKSGIEIKIGK